MALPADPADRIRGALGKNVWLAVALPGPVTAVPGVDGSLWLGPATAVLLAVGVPGCTGTARH